MSAKAPRQECVWGIWGKVRPEWLGQNVTATHPAREMDVLKRQSDPTLPPVASCSAWEWEYPAHLPPWLLPTMYSSHLCNLVPPTSGSFLLLFPLPGTLILALWLSLQRRPFPGTLVYHVTLLISFIIDVIISHHQTYMCACQVIVSTREPLTCAPACALL